MNYTSQARTIDAELFSQGYEYLLELRSRPDGYLYEYAMRYITAHEIIRNGIASDEELKSFIENYYEK
ncbi:MAG: hypothetical protein RTU63_00905 [Candidatus Thorarchaeota archaeon]